MADDRLIEIYRARDVIDAHLVKGALEEEGIAARVVGEELQNAIGGLPPGWSSAPAVLVHEVDAARAQEIIASLDRPGSGS